MTNEQVAICWANGIVAQAENYRSDGVRLYSYQAVIAEHRGDGKPSRITTRKYSVTTSRHTNLAAKAMPGAVREEF